MIRFFDLLFSLLGLVLLSPFLIIVYVFIILESRGRGFYTQQRVGLKGVNLN